MKLSKTLIRPAARVIAAAVLLMMVYPAVRTAAQTFQFHYGGATCRESAHNGVQKVTTGGYIAAGHSYSPVAGCAGSDAYVVRTTATGGLIWSFTYNIGAFDSATDVQQCTLNGGGFIVTGVTSNTAACGGTRDIFLLRLDINGNVLWVRTYGSTKDEIPWDVFETRTGDNVTTVPGDFVVAGSTTLNPGVGPRDGYILRTRSNGVLIWDRTYGGPNSGDDYYLGATEAVVGVPAGTAGDIVAVGGYVVGGNMDAVVVRVNGNNGTFGPAPRLAVTIGTAASKEEFRSVQELTVGASAGQLAMAGWTTSGVANTDAWVVKLAANPCGGIIAQRRFGDGGANADEAFSIREITAAGLNVGNLIATGFATLAGGLGGADAFALEFTTALVPVGPITVYGGTGADRGWSVNQVAAGAGSTVGFIIAGFTQSPNLIGADPQQMYLIKTNAAKQSGCFQANPAFMSAVPAIPPTCRDFVTGVIGVSCIPAITKTGQVWATQLCFAPMARENGNGNDGAAGVELSESAGAMRSYPNPIASGTTLNLEYPVTAGADATVTVSDMRGVIVHRGMSRQEPGTAKASLVTEGWAAGTYIVKVEIGGHSYTTRVVVTE